jgi:site-specific DNA-methyltransferase (adenine-specific)
MKDISDNYYELAIVDPPYGRKEHGGKNRSGYAKQFNGKIIKVKAPEYKKKNWDNKPVSKECLDEIIRISKNQIIFGINYYTFFYNFGSGRIIWDKVNGNTDQSDCEILYNSINTRVDMFSYLWQGMLQGLSENNGKIQRGNKKLNEKRIHPTQKPIALYKWILKNYANSGDKIFDSHVGSGSSRIACYELGFDFEGCELDKDYYNNQEKRFMEFKKKFHNEFYIPDEKNYLFKQRVCSE